MGGIKANFFRNAEVLPPNTFIGGVGGVGGALENPSDWIYGDIVNFIIDANNNVSFFRENLYTMDAGFGLNIFQNNTAITYILDLEGMCISFRGWNELNNTSNLKYFYFPSVVDFVYNISYPGLRNMSSLEKVNIESAQDISTYLGFDNLKVKKLYLPSLTTLGSSDIRRADGIFNNLINCERLYLGNLTNPLNWYTLNNYAFKGIKSGCKVYYPSNLGVKNRASWASVLMNSSNVGTTITINGLVYTSVSGAPTVDGEFTGDVAITTARNNFVNAVNNDTRTGTFGKVNAVLVATFLPNIGLFQTVNGVGGDGDVITTSGGFTLTKDTFSGGNDVHQSLQILRDYDGANLIEVSTPITVDPPTSLNASNITANTVDLNFTAPTPNANGTDGYEVWVDDGTVYRKLFEYAEIIASGDTLNLAEVVADVGSISGIKIKIRTFDGHFNFSAFSNEITIP